MSACLLVLNECGDLRDLIKLAGRRGSLRTPRLTTGIVLVLCWCMQHHSRILVIFSGAVLHKGNIHVQSDINPSRLCSVKSTHRRSKSTRDTSRASRCQCCCVASEVRVGQKLMSVSRSCRPASLVFTLMSMLRPNRSSCRQASLFLMNAATYGMI